ncbi:MAG: peptidoglycan editing factor PgeF [Anaerolineaceae bacterium]
MKLTRKNGVEYYQFDTFDSKLVNHAFFTRKGGVSPEPWKSLNQGGTVEDQRENVVENRRRVFAAIDRPVESIFDVWQVHGTNVICTSIPRNLDEEHAKADAMITNQPNVTLFMRFADCVPILMYDPDKLIISITHAGWGGTVKKIVSRTVQTLVENFKCDPNRLVAGIGPSIGVCHYQVGDEVITAVRDSFGKQSENFLVQREGKTYFDLWKANQYLLAMEEVGSIEVANLCTACHTEDWFSHRKESGKTGRFCATMFLNTSK